MLEKKINCILLIRKEQNHEVKEATADETNARNPNNSLAKAGEKTWYEKKRF
jgi:hypothetical protein